MGDWAGAVVAAVALVFVVLQWLIQRGQHRLQEAEAYRQQAAAWAALAQDWERALLAATGSAAVFRFGVPSTMANDYFMRVESYRIAKVGFISIQEGDIQNWDGYQSKVAEALEGINPYRQSVQRVVLHLAQVSGLVLGGRLSLDVAYDALGLPLLRVGNDVRNLMRESYANSTSCPGPLMTELYYWQKVDAEQMSARLGWGDFLDVAQGTAERIAVFLDLLTVRGLEKGDIGPYARDHADETPGIRLADSDRLALAWRAGRRQSRRTAVKLVVRLAKAGRRAKRLQPWRASDRTFRLFGRSQTVPGHLLPSSYPQLRAPLDTVAVMADVTRAAVRARSACDVRLLDPPDLPNGVG